jgi:tetratricopeptide (TPR) repeat protein
VLTLDKKAIKFLLMKLYENKPTYPIQHVEALTQALGGENQLLFVNENTGEIPSTVLAKRILDNNGEITEMNEIINSLIEDSYINIIIKAKLMDIIENLEYPIETKDDFLQMTRELIIFGVPVEELAEKLDYPIEKMDQILNRLKLIDKELLDANLDRISNIKDTQEIVGVIEDINTSGDSSSDSSDAGDLDLDDKSLRKKIKEFVAQGKDAYREQRYEDALKIYEQGLKLDPDDTELRFLKNSIIQKLKDLEGSDSEDQEIQEPEEELETAKDKDEEKELGATELTVEQKELTEAKEPIEPKEVIEELPEEPIEPSEQHYEKVDADDQSAEPVEPDGKAEDETEVESQIEPDPTANDQSVNKIDDRIEELGKRLHEKVSLLKNLSTTATELPEDACTSCEGKGECYWCKNSGKCAKCSGTGKDVSGETCETCGGSGECHSCKGSGKCHWCSGTGKKK